MQLQSPQYDISMILWKFMILFISFWEFSRDLMNMEQAEYTLLNPLRFIARSLDPKAFKILVVATIIKSLQGTIKLHHPPPRYVGAF